MSCGSLDSFRNILGDSFKGLSSALSCVDNTAVAIAEQQSVLTDQLGAATAAITPEMVAMLNPIPVPDPLADPLAEPTPSAEPEFKFEDIQGYISGIGASVGDFASQAVGQTGGLVEGLKSSIIGGQANYALDSALGNGDTPQEEKFSDLTEKTSNICKTIGDGLKAIRDKVASVVAAISTAIASFVGGAIDALKDVFNSLKDAASAVVSAVSNAISSVASAISDMVSSAAAAVQEAFCKGMELAFPSMGPDAVKPTIAPPDLAGTEFI